MSFPYTTTAPPPTSGALPIVESANLSQSYGGGSGPGPSPTSSIGAGLASVECDPTSSAISLTTSGANADINLTTNTGGTFSLQADSITMTNNINSVSLSVLSDQVSVGGGPFTFTSPFVSTSALLVSSINGQAPGGSAGPNPVVSSIVVNSGDYSISSGGIEFTGQADFFGYAAVSNGGGQPIQYPNPNSTIIGVAKTPGVNPEYSDVGIGRIVLVGQPSFGGTITKPGIIQAGDGSSISNSDILIQASGNILLNSAGVSSIICMGGTTTISTLNVSTINGAAPGGSAPFFSTLFSGSSTINCDGGTTQTLIPFNTTAGHLYQIQTQMSVQPRTGATQTPGAGDFVIQEVLGQVYMNETQGDVVVAADAANADVKIGCCSMFKSTGGPNTLDIIGSFSTTATLNSVWLVDFGAV